MKGTNINIKRREKKIMVPLQLPIILFFVLKLLYGIIQIWVFQFQYCKNGTNHFGNFGEKRTTYDK